MCSKVNVNPFLGKSNGDEIESSGRQKILVSPILVYDINPFVPIGLTTTPP